MTFKKSMISIAAAAVIAAGITGCGSSSSTTAATTTTTTDTTTSSIQSSVKAVDGYIYNATVKAYYVNEDNTTMGSATLEYTPTTKNTNTSVVTLGTSTYSLSAADDANASIKDRIRFFTVATTASSDDGNVTFTPAAYIESDGVDGYDVNDTLLGTTTIYAPASSGIASPLTNLIYQANIATLGSITTAGTAAAEFNSTILTALEANATKIATNLGLGDINLLTADPIQLAATNPTFKLVTALLKGASTADANTILGATAATTLSGTLEIIDGLASADGAAFAATLKSLVDNGAFSTSDVANLNIEKSIVDNSINSLTAPTIDGKFPISGITVDGSDYANFAAAGAKLDISANETVDINMSLATSDVNVSNTTFNLLVAFKTSKISVADDSNTSSSVVAKIPFDLNITDGEVMTAGVEDATLVPFQLKNADGSAIITKSDINATTLGLVTGDVAVSNDVVQINIENILTALVSDAVESNVTGTLETIDGQISDVQILLQDSTGSIVGASDTSTMLPLAKANFTDIGTGAITGNEAIKVLALSTS